MPPTLDDLSLKLLDTLQREIPLVERPFAAIASALSVDEQQVLDRVSSLRAKSGGVIRQISAIFDSRTLGYQSCLVAARVDESHLESAVAAINAHPGVSHNYRRNHAYNVWYTVAVPPDSRLGLQRTVDLLHQRSGAIATRLMPALKMYKIGVKFDLGGESDPSNRSEEPVEVRSNDSFIATPRDKRLVQVLQQDLPAISRPFDAWADQAQVNIEELLSAARGYIECGAMRRFSAVLRHREAGFGFNAMGCWIVPPEDHDRFGRAAAAFSAVSHCYLRPCYEDWPYSIFTMVHGQQKSDCEAVLASIAQSTGVSNYTPLYSSHEYKKVRVKYFTPEIEAWEQAAMW